MILHRQVFMNIKIAKKIVFSCMLVGMTCFLNATEVMHKNMPPLEKSFIKIMKKALDEYSSTTNEVKKTKIRIDLQESLSNLLKDRVAKDWVGEVAKIWTDDSSDARALVVLSREYHKDVSVGTAPDKSSDEYFGIHTCIDIGTNLYNAVSELEIGDKVIFSGRFILPLPDLLLVSISGVEGIGILQFTSIKKIQSVKKSK